MRGGEPNMWSGLATLRNGQVERRWNRIQMLMYFNMFAIPLVYGANISGLVFGLGVKVAISWVGFCLHMGISYAAWRGERWNRFWSRKMAQLELLDQNASEEGGKTRVFVFACPEYDMLYQDARIQTRLSYLVAGIAILAWFFTAMYFTALAIKQ